MSATLANIPQNSAIAGPVEEYHGRREIWKRKPQIRLVYERWLEKMRPFLPPQGTVLEVGSGSGLLREFLPGVLLSDVTLLPWIDWVADCMHLPFQESALDAIIGFDMLHHVSDPHAFLREAARVLKPGGRLLLMEPFITPISYLGYSLLHHEGVYFGGYHPAAKTSGEKSDPWQGNLAMSNIVFHHDAKRWHDLQPALVIRHEEIFSFVDFQFAAGFKPYAYLPHWLFRRLIGIDDYLARLMRLIGFRIFVVLEKK